MSFPQDYFTSYGYVTVFFLAGAAFVLFTIGVSNAIARLAPPRHQSLDKARAYESGELPVGDAWIQFRVHFFIFALLFVVFDVEAIFLIAWAVLFKSLGFVGFVEVMLFAGVLVCGLAYAWRKGALRWV